jgi:hypothetical protein
MVNLQFGDLKDNKKDKNLTPISIVKGTRNKYYNKIVYLNNSEQNNSKYPSDNIQLDLPLTNFFNILPETDEFKRNVYYIAGKSGSGKSYISKQIIENYYKLYPDRNLFLISKLEHDETIDSVKAPLKRIPVEVFTENFNINNYSHCLIMFDDYDSIEGKTGKILHEIIKDIAIMGRHHGDQGNITMILATHYLTNYSKTRLILNEATDIIIYPQNTSHHQLKYLIKNYIGLDDKDIKRLKQLGRWVLFHVGFNGYMMSQNEIRLLNKSYDDDDNDNNVPVRKKKSKSI